MQSLPLPSLRDDAVGDKTLKYDPVPLFLGMLTRFGIPAPTREFSFAKHFTPRRNWRFDFAWPGKFIALEVEGAVWVRGRHTRGSGFLKDMEKYNAAALHQWRVFRTTPDKLTDLSTVRLVGEALGVTVGEIGTL